MTTGFFYVNIDLRHRYGISLVESQTFLPRETSPAAKSEEKRLFLRAESAPGEREMGGEGGEQQEVSWPFSPSCARASSKFLPSPWLS